MKRVLLDYSMLSALANPGISKTDKANNPFFAYMSSEQKIQAVCFDFQLQAINITSYKRKAIEEETNLKGFENIMNSDECFIDEGDSMIILQRQKSIVDRFNKKTDRIANLFSSGFVHSIATSFVLPSNIIPQCVTHFIDEDDLLQFNIEVIPLNKAQLMRILNYINQWKEKNPDFKISDFLFLDLITRMLSSFLKIDEWFFCDSENRLDELNTVFNNPLFQQTIKESELYPTLIRQIWKS